MSSAGLSISTLGEHALIARIKTRAGDAPPWVQIGIGDDAAVIEPARGELDIVTTDCQVEDVHFSRAWMSMREIGAKALAVNISDMAAMAADPGTQKWWAVCMPLQSPLETRKEGEWWADMEEVFHVD